MNYCNKLKNEVSDIQIKGAEEAIKVESILIDDNEDLHEKLVLILKNEIYHITTKRPCEGILRKQAIIANKNNKFPNNFGREHLMAAREQEHQIASATF